MFAKSLPDYVDMLLLPSATSPPLASCCLSPSQMFAKSLRELQTDYIDMLLLHYPECWGSLCSEAKQSEGTWQDRWGAKGPGSAVLPACPPVLLARWIDGASLRHVVTNRSHRS